MIVEVLDEAIRSSVDLRLKESNDEKWDKEEDRHDDPVKLDERITVPVYGNPHEGILTLAYAFLLMNHLEPKRSSVRLDNTRQIKALLSRCYQYRFDQIERGTECNGMRAERNEFAKDLRVDKLVGGSNHRNSLS